MILPRFYQKSIHLLRASTIVYQISDNLEILSSVFLLFHTICYIVYLKKKPILFLDFVIQLFYNTLLVTLFFNPLNMLD